MNLIKEDQDKKIFADGNNKIYSMINMGSYIGYRHREWYDNTPDVWMLMFYDEKRDNNQELHISALVDDEGNYIRFLIDLGNKRRVVQLHNGKVFSDTIVENVDMSYRLLGDEFVALDGDIYSSKSVLLERYLHSNPSFYLNGQIYEGELSKNIFISNFLQKNDELQEMLTHGKKR